MRIFNKLTERDKYVNTYKKNNNLLLEFNLFGNFWIPVRKWDKSLCFNVINSLYLFFIFIIFFLLAKN